MNFCGTLPLKTQRCYLRKLEIKDYSQLYENVYSDENVSRYMSWDKHKTPQETKDYLTLWQEYYKDPTECYWGIFLSDSDTLIGTVYLYPENKKAEIGFLSYCLGSQFWKKGYGTEMVKAVLEYGFNTIGYYSITALCAKSNAPSYKLLQRSGFTFDGCLRNRDKTYLGYEDCYYFSILKDEYYSLFKN